jgi:hypothetical protein
MDVADRAVLDRVAGVLAALDERALRRAWAALQQPNDTGKELAAREQEARKIKEHLAAAASLLVDGTLDKEGYAALRDRDTARLKAVAAEQRRLGSAAHRGTALPPVEQVLGLAGGWAAALHGFDVADQRAVLAELVQQVVVRREGWRRYAAEITWTPLGAALHAAAYPGE